MAHSGADGRLTQAEFEQVVRTATKVVAASDASAASLALADYFCDGTADEVQIQAAIDAMPSSGGSITLSEGTYTFGADANIDDDNIKIIGYGATIQASTDISYAFHITGDYDTLEGITFSCNVGTNAIYYPIYINTASHTTITYCIVTEVQTDPGGTYGVAIHMHSGVTYADINHNYIADGGVQTYGILSGYGGVANTQINVSNNFVKDMGYNGIGMYSDTSYFVVDSNIVESSGHNCISASASHYGTISNNVVYDATDGGESGIEVETNAAHGAFHTYNISVIGNTIHNCNAGITLRDNGSIYDVYDVTISGNNIYNVADALIRQHDEVYRLTIVGNVCQDAASHGLSFESLTYSTITSNTVSNVIASGIVLNACSHNIVSNNIIYDVNNGLTANHGIRLLTTSTYNIITGNQIINTGGNAAGEGYAYSEGAAVDDYNVIRDNICKDNYSLGLNIKGVHDAVDYIPISVEMDLSDAAEDFSVIVATMPCQIAGYVTTWTEAAGDANTCDIRVGEITSGGAADDDEFDIYTTAGNETLGESVTKVTSDMTDTTIAAGTIVTVGHTQKVGGGKVRITLWIVEQAT